MNFVKKMWFWFYRLLFGNKELFHCNTQQSAPTPNTSPSTTPTTVTPRSNSWKISVLNQSTVITDDQAKDFVEKALQVQVTRDFAPIYGIDAQLTFIPKGQTPDPKSWWLILLDSSDQAGALGYHDLTSEGLPIGKAFLKDDIQSGAKWTVTVSHELLEMLADPWINLTVFVQDSNSSGVLYALEVCDTCEADEYGYDIGGYIVSDFAFPGWWGVPGYTGPLDFQNHVKSVLQILPGGYIGKFDVASGTGWVQKQNKKILHAHRNDFKKGSRRERRIRAAHNWRHSSAHKGHLNSKKN